MHAGKMIAIEIYDEPAEPGKPEETRQLLERAEIECVAFDAATGIGDFRIELTKPRTFGAGAKWIEGTVKAFPFAQLNRWDLALVALKQAIGSRSDEATLARLRAASGKRRTSARHDAEALETGE